MRQGSSVSRLRSSGSAMALAAVLALNIGAAAMAQTPAADARH